MLLEEKLVEMLDKINSSIIDIAPKAYELMLNVKQAESIAYLLLGFVMLAASTTLAYLWFRNYRYAEAKAKESIGGYWPEPCVVLAVVVVFLFVPSTICMLHNILDVWNWIGAFKPELALAKDILDITIKN